MSYIKCEKCGDYHFTHERCPDVYTIYDDEYLGENGKKMNGYSFEDAAENYGKYRNDEGYLLEETITFEIEDQKGTRKKFEVSAEIAIDYRVKEIS